MRAAEVDELVARVEQPAVDGTRPHRLQTVRERREHGLVEQREPFGHARLLHQDAALEEGAERDQRVVVEAPTELLHPPGARTGGVEVTPHERGHLEVERVAVLGPFVLVGEQAQGSGLPAVGLGAVTPQTEEDRGHERRERGTAPVAVGEVELVGALVGGDGFVGTTDPVRGVGQQIDLGRAERLARAQGVVGLLPRTSFVRLEAGFEIGHAGHSGSRVTGSETGDCNVR